MASASESSVLAKALEGFQWAARPELASRLPAEGDPTGHERFLQGRQAELGRYNGCGALLHFSPSHGSLVMAFKGSHRLFADLVVHAPSFETPGFLAKLAPGAQVHSAFVKVFSDLLDSPTNPDSILGALGPLLTGRQPRSVLLAGYCVGGSIATLAAPWAALRWPAADVRCITVGSPKLGDHAFAEAYSWLVGLSYRGVYKMDPMPDGPYPGMNKRGPRPPGAAPLAGRSTRFRLEFRSTWSDIYLDGRTARLMERPLVLRYDWRDHELADYMAQMQALAQGGVPPALAAPLNALGQVELLDPGVAAQESELREAALHGACASSEAGTPPSSGLTCTERNSGGSGVAEEPGHSDAQREAKGGFGLRRLASAFLGCGPAPMRSFDAGPMRALSADKEQLMRLGERRIKALSLPVMARKGCMDVTSIPDSPALPAYTQNLGVNAESPKAGGSPRRARGLHGAEHGPPGLLPDLCWPETKEQLESLRSLHEAIYGEQGYIGTAARVK